MMEDRVPVIAQLTGPRDVSYAEVGRFLARGLAPIPDWSIQSSALENGMPTGSTPRNTTLDSSYHRDEIWPDRSRRVRRSPRPLMDFGRPRRSADRRVQCSS